MASTMGRTDESNKGIARVEGTNADWMAQYSDDDKSLSTLEMMVILPRMKIIQGQSDADLKKQFGEGSVVIRPGDAVVWQDGNPPFLFVPLSFHIEFNKWSDINDKTGPKIVEGPIYNEKHPCAIKARDRNLRNEGYPGHDKKPARDQWFFSYVEHLCWTGMIYGDHTLAGTEVVMSMERGEYYQGRELINAMSMRRETIKMEGQPDRRVKVPLWAQVWALQPTLRNGEKGNWFGLDFQAADVPVIQQEDAAKFQARHAELEALRQAGKLKVDHAAAAESAPEKVSDAPGEF